MNAYNSNKVISGFATIFEQWKPELIDGTPETGYSKISIIVNEVNSLQFLHLVELTESVPANFSIHHFSTGFKLTFF